MLSEYYMPAPLNSVPGFTIHRYVDVYGVTQTNPNSPKATMGDLVVNTNTGIWYEVTGVDINNIPALVVWKDVSGNDYNELSLDPSQYNLVNSDVLPLLTIYKKYTNGKTRSLAIPDRRIKLRHSEITSYRLFLGVDVSLESGRVISGHPESGIIDDRGVCKRSGDSYLGVIEGCYISYELSDGEIVTAVFYDRSDNILSVYSMTVKNRGAEPTTVNERVSVELISPYLSESDDTIIDCRDLAVIDVTKFMIRVGYDNGSYTDHTVYDPAFDRAGFTPFIDGISGNVSDIVIIDRTSKLTARYKALRGVDGDQIISGIDPLAFDWIVSPYGASSGRMVMNGNNRPQSISGPLVLYPKTTDVASTRYESMIITGTYTGSGVNAELGDMFVYDVAGNVISYNLVKSFTNGAGGAENQFMVRLNLYHVANQNIGGIVMKTGSSTVTVNSIFMNKQWASPYIQFGIQAAGTVLNYTDSSSVNNGIVVDVDHRRSLDNEPMIAAGSALVATGGHPLLFNNPLTVGGLPVGNYFVPKYSAVSVDHQGMEFVGTNIRLNDNSYAFEVVVKLAGDITLNTNAATAGWIPNSDNLMSVRSISDGETFDPYMSVKIGDNEIRLYTHSKKVSLVNSVESKTFSTPDNVLTVNVNSLNPEGVNVITVVRSLSLAHILVNGLVCWTSTTMDYDEAMGPQRVTVDWNDTVQRGPVPYLRSVLVYNTESMVLEAMGNSLTVPMHKGYLDSVSAVRINGIVLPSIPTKKWLDTSAPADLYGAATVLANGYPEWWSNVVLALKFDHSGSGGSPIIDSSILGNVPDAVAGCSIVTSDSMMGTGYLNSLGGTGGSRARLEYAASTNFEFRNRFTIAFWINVSFADGGTEFFLGRMGGAVYAHINRGGQAFLNFINYGGGNTINLSYDTRHYVTYTRDGSYVYTSVDGIVTQGPSQPFNYPGPLEFNVLNLKGLDYLNALNAIMDDFIFVNGAVVPEFKSNFTPPTRSLIP